jgi:hypothetical protein
MRPDRRLFVVLGLALTALASACSVGVGTPPDEYAAEQRDGGEGGGGGGGGGGEDVDLLVEGPQQAIADLSAEIGGERIQALLLAISSDAVFLEIPSSDPGQAERYKWDAADGVTSLGTRAVSAPGLEPFALNSIDYAGLPDLVAEAPAAAGLQGQVNSNVDIRRAGGQTLITVSMVTPRGDAGAVVADANGQILSTT